MRVVSSPEGHALEIGYARGGAASGPGVTARYGLRFELGYRLTLRFEVVEFSCDYAVLGGMFTTFGHTASGGTTSGPTLCDSGKVLAGRDCKSTLPMGAGWHVATVVANAPTESLARAVTLAIDGRDIPGQTVEVMPGRTTLDLLVGPHYMPAPSDPGNCASIRILYDDILVESRAP